MAVVFILQTIMYVKNMRPFIKSHFLNRPTPVGRRARAFSTTWTLYFGELSVNAMECRSYTQGVMRLKHAGVYF